MRNETHATHDALTEAHSDSLNTGTLARIAYEAAAASLAETHGREHYPPWEIACQLAAGTEAAYHAAVMAVVEAIADMAFNHEVKPHHYWADMLVERCDGAEYSVGPNIAKWLRAIIAPEPRKGIEV